MATGRVGGTKSKITGQVGNEIFQIRKNPDGSYTQITYVKGVRTETQTSERLQAQRMVTCMVESLMKDLKPVGQISMQSGRNKTTSLNAFSSMNLRYVAADCKANWYQSNEFVYPLPAKDWGKTKDLGGAFWISSGTGTKNHFNRCLLSNTPQWLMNGWTNNNANFVGLEFVIPNGCSTIGQYLRAAKITRLDKVVFCAFHFRLVEDENTGLGDWISSHEYIIASVNPSLSDSSDLSLESFRALFLLEQKHDLANWWQGKDGKSFYLGVQEDLMADDNYYYIAAFTISYATGKKLITDSQYTRTGSRIEPWLAGQSPADVFGYWMGDPSIDPYPSPFQ